MSTRKYSFVFSLVIAVIFALGQGQQTRAQDRKTPYPRIAPFNQYLMARNAEIALARSAAPESISRNAEVLVLGRQGYETAVKGKNGFVCDVDRSWLSPFNSAQFWNPKIRGAVCYNPPAARSVLPITHMMTKMVLAGLPKAQMFEDIKVAYARKELPALEPGAMSFMMSKHSYLTDDGAHDVAHLMFYTPRMDGANWGADLPGSPVYLISPFEGTPEPIDVFIVLTGEWSDGTPAPLK
jgi:hypothetical protein